MSDLFPTPHVTGLDSSPAGEHDEGERNNRARHADIWKGIYHWVQKKLPSPGAQNYAYETLGLVEFTPIGYGVHVRTNWMITQPPQPYINGQAVPVTGLGGLSAGQLALQPLYDPVTNTYSGQQ
jgi:hypothetical protein